MKRVNLKETEVVKIVMNHFERGGYSFVKPMKIRGRIPDIIATKDDKITLVEAKGLRGDVLRGFAQALHYSNCANFSYLAMPKHLIKSDTIASCKNLGIGLLSVEEKKIIEVAKPRHNHTLKSVSNAVFKGKKMKSSDMIIIKQHHELNKKANICTNYLLENILNKTSLKVLRKMCENTEKDFTITEISDEIDCDKSAVSRIMPILIENGIITYNKRGMNKICKINTKNELVTHALMPLFDKESTMIINKTKIGDGYA